MPENQLLARTIREWMEILTGHTLHEQRRYIRSCGLSMPQFFILMHLYHRDHCGLSELSDRMETSSAAASQLVDRLAQAGLILRTEDPADRRARQIALTDKGRALIENSMVERHRWVEDLAAGLSTEEQDVISKALPVLVAAIQRTDSHCKTGKDP